MHRKVVNIPTLAQPSEREPVPQIMDTERLERRIGSDQPLPDLSDVRREVPIRSAIGVQEGWGSSIQHDACIAAWCPPIQGARPIGLGADQPDLLAAAIDV